MIESAFGWFMEKVFIPGFMLLMMIGLPALIVAFIWDAKRETFALKKGDWSCTQVHEYTSSTSVMVGKVMVPQTRTNKDCIQWSRTY